MTSNQVQVSQFFSEFTQYENEGVQEIYTTLDGYCKVQQAYSPDNDYPPSEVQKYAYHSSYPSNKKLQKNTQMNYLVAVLWREPISSL